MLNQSKKNKLKVQEALRVTEEVFELNSPETITEIRILKTNKGTKAGLFDLGARVYEEIIPYDNQYNIFINLNVVDEKYRKKVANKLIDYSKETVSDKMISKRRFLLVDIDPERPSGVSATKEELRKANELAEAVKEFLYECGYPEPVKACSGNGIHLLYYVDLPNTTEINLLVKRWLASLSYHMSTDECKVDTSVYNASRIVKLYGTVATKGEHTQERPHRRSYIISVPEKKEIVDIALIHLVANMLPDETIEKKQVISHIALKSLDVQEWLQKYKISVSHTKDWNGGAICYVLDKCPWNSEHTDKGACIIQFPNGAISAKCHHESCCDQNWFTLRKKYEDRYEHTNSSKRAKAVDLKKSQADIMLEIILNTTDVFFHDQLGEPWVAVKHNEKFINYKIGQQKYKLLMKKRYYDTTKKTISTENLKQAVGVLEAKAVFEGETKQLYKRCARDEVAIYYHLNNAESEVVRVDSQGWSIDKNCRNLFYTRPHMLAQDSPITGGNLLELHDKHYKFTSEEDKILHTVSLVSKLIPDIVHPIDIIHGEKGAAKSTTMKFDRFLIDPSESAAIAMPKGNEDLALALSNNYMPCFDNIDVISAEKSDILCMATTGGAIAKRKLYTDDEEVIIKIKAPIVLNGINIVATRADLLDRCLVIGLKRIAKKDRKEEVQVWNEFLLDRPKFLGAMLTTVSKAMHIYPTVQLSNLSRMADFTRWGYAIAEACGIGGKNFLTAYEKNQSKANKEAIASHPVGQAIIFLMEEYGVLECSVTELYELLKECAERHYINTHTRLWPSAANALSRRLNEIKSNLEEQGIYYDIRHDASAKIIRIEKED